MTRDREARIEALEARVQELTDREAIRDLRCRYHERINEGRWADIAPLFAEDAELDFGCLGQASGRAELTALFTERAPRLLPFVKQFIHNHVVELHGDEARGFSYLEAKSVSSGEPYLVAARYDDRYVKQQGEWRFAAMRLTPYFTVPLREGWAQEDRLKMGR